MLYRHSVLIVDANDEAREFLSTQLIDNGGFAVQEASTIQEALARALAQHDQIGAIIIDGDMPDGSGAELLMNLRRKHFRAPIIRLVDADEPIQTVGLAWLVEPCLVKPVAFGVLLKTLVAQIHLFESGDSAVFPLGPYSFRSASRTLHTVTDGAITKLSEKEAALLKSLLRARGRIVLRRRLLEEVWGLQSSAETQTVESHIYRLRKKLQKNAPNFDFVVTETGGYRLEVAQRAK
jgi:DNA-binding response OmpR family regulator